MDTSKGYFATPATGMVMGMLEALRIIDEEGLEARWRRHKILSEALRAGLKAIGLDWFPAKGHEAHTLTVPVIPEGINDADMRSMMMNKYRVIIAGGLGKLGGKTVRVGHMGNCTFSDLVATMSSMEISLKELGHKMDMGTGVGAAEEVFISNKT